MLTESLKYSSMCIGLYELEAACQPFPTGYVPGKALHWGRRTLSHVL